MVDIFVDIIAGILLFIIGWFCSRCYNYFRLRRPLSKVLGTLSEYTKHTIIVIPKLYSHADDFKLKRPGDATETIQWSKNLPLFAEGDAKSMMYIYNLLLRSGKKTRALEIKSDAELTGEEKRGDLVCIGAGSNSATKDFLTRIDPPLSFEQRTIQTDRISIQMFGTSIIDRTTSERWVASQTYDYGLIARLRNPNNPDAHILVLAGLGPSGTAASGYFISTHWKQIYDFVRMKKSTKDNFVALLKTNVTDPTDVTLIKTAIV
jgi:hypothetical protein